MTGRTPATAPRGGPQPPGGGACLPSLQLYAPGHPGQGGLKLGPRHARLGSDGNVLMAAASDAQLASVLQQLLNEYSIYDVGSFADCLRGDAGDALADWMLSNGDVQASGAAVGTGMESAGGMVDAAAATDGTGTVDQSCTASFSSAGARLVNLLVNVELQTSVPSSSRAVQAAIDLRQSGTLERACSGYKLCIAAQAPASHLLSSSMLR